ncbi:MAG: DNA-directed RNA polymerase subunit beta' [Candidatus Margulisbacteria bacterium]|nr:DNA-directed RNA polymerase subunit beta' [Candidatus Margulisiibacteriota bacterium]
MNRMLVTSPSDFDYLEIGLASPDRIRFWSHGEIEKPETINYRTFKPERKGLFCEKIFGPVKDWECSCGKYRRVRYRGIVCERCGVQVTHSKVRREHMGHIELAAPVSHIWFLKSIPSYMGLVLDMSSRNLEEVLYYDSYIVLKVDKSISDEISVKQTFSTVEYMELKEKYGEKFKVGMGASAIRDILTDINLEKLTKELRASLDESKGQKRLKNIKRLRIVEALHKSGNRPEWMILDAIPVMPPDLRPMVQLEGGRFATSDLNDLYRRVVNRNNRLKRLMDIGAPQMIIRNEKRMLQESVDVLISNGKRGRAVTGSNGRPLKSLGNIIEGKQGRFRQNLLGKRVDYSGRSVIVVGPHFKLHQCGLPKEMALELFKPFVIRELVSRGHVTNVKTAKRKIESRDVVVWDVLEDVIKGQPILLNRAPTLHRLGIQAFEPVLVEGSAIQIHPLVCTAFNADFDGDQMAVHVPLSLEAQSECRLLIMSTNNILSPSNGKSIVTPSQDMVLGIYYLTIDDPESEKGKGKVFADIAEAWRALENKAIGLQTNIKVRIDKERIATTIGRIIFNDTVNTILKDHNLPKHDYINRTLGKKELSDLVFEWYNKHGNNVTSEIIDRIKSLGFKYSTLSGISISVDDLIIPKNKAQIIANTEKEILRLDKLASSGVITNREKILRSNDLWRETTWEVSSQMEAEFGRLNNIFIMANSGARGNIDQVRQLAGMRGLMSDAQGRVVNVPIKANFKEGLSLTDYFISSYGARKGLVDTALRTADSGYLTRRLVDVAQDVMITETDCGTKQGLVIESVKDGVSIVVPLSEMIKGRIATESLKKPGSNNLIVSVGELITEDISREIEELNNDSFEVRSIYKCQSERGVCQKCYGLSLATNKLINLGEAVGIIAAQSIGEPGTQLTMRTFHTGGVDLRKASKTEISSKHEGMITFDELLSINRIKDEQGNMIMVSSSDGKIVISNKNDKWVYPVAMGSTIHVKPNQKVKMGDTLAEYDPNFEYIVSKSDGIIRYFGANVKERKDDKGKSIELYAQNDGEIFIYNPKSSTTFKIPKDSASLYKKGDRIKAHTEIAPGNELEMGGIVASIEKGKEDTYDLTVGHGEAYHIFSGARFFIHESGKVKYGDIIAVERVGDLDESKTKDIVQGLPRVEELFEARKPKDHAIIAGHSGTVEVIEKDGNRFVTISNKEEKNDYKIPYGVRLKVHSGQAIIRGEQLSYGVINPHDILSVSGIFKAQAYLSNEVQKVYRSQGVTINIKHIEVIVRQMTRKMNITTIGDGPFLPNDLIDIQVFNKMNQKLIEDGKVPSTGERILLGITRSSLNTDSFISSASFQETSKVLADAAIKGKKDLMRGLKENVIIGKLIPAGTGLDVYKRISLETDEGKELHHSEEDRVFNKSEAKVEETVSTA